VVLEEALYHPAGRELMNEKWLTVKEVAEYLQLSPDQIYHLAQQGKIPASKVGARWRFKREKIDEWMEEQTVVTQSYTRRGQS
jgi:excisionase family DNA binding protein